MPLDLWKYLSPEQQEELRRLAGVPQQPSPLAPQPGPTPEAALLADLTGQPPRTLMAGAPAPSPSLAPQPGAAAPSTWASPWGALPLPRGSGTNVELLNALFRDVKPVDPKALSAELTDEERAEARRAGWAGVAAGVAQTPWNATPAQALANAFAGYAQGAYQGRADIRDRRKEALALADKDIEARYKLAELFKTKAADTFGSAETGYYTLGADGTPVQLVPGVGPKPGTPLAIQDPNDPSKQILVNPYTMAPLRNPDNSIARPKPEGTPSDISRLMAERDALAPNDPRRAVLEAAIKKKVDETGDQSVVAIVGADGKPIFVKREDAVGKTPASTREASAPFNMAKDLRSAFEKQIADAQTIVTKYGQMKAGFEQDSKSGDVAALFAFMKMLDPTSVVRETEFATAGQAGALPDVVQGWWDKLTGQGRLTPAQRAEITAAGVSQIAPYKQRYDETVANYTNLARSFELKPEDVVVPLTWPEIQQAAPAARGAPTPAPNPSLGF